MQTFKDTAAGYYNALVEGLGLSGSSVQLVQPTVIPSDDASLWAFLDQLPPTSLYRNGDADNPMGSFFGTYEEILASLQIPSKNRFLETVGKHVADDFIRFLSERSTNPPPVNKYPAIFRSWALLHHPTVAIKGTTALAGMLLEPLAAATVALLGYQDGTTQPPRPGRPPDWDETYDELLTSLEAGPSREFSINSATIDNDVANTWTGGNIGSHAGLWAASTPTTVQSEKFSNSEFTLNVSMGHLLLFRPVPGTWYSSASLGIAHSNPGSPPWALGSPVTWDQAFGVSGRLRNIVASLIIVDLFEVTIRSVGPYTQDDQDVILSNQSSGLWPLYLTTNVETTCSFSPSAALEIRLKTEAGSPVLIGVLATSIEQYLGH